MLNRRTDEAGVTESDPIAIEAINILLNVTGANISYREFGAIFLERKGSYRDVTFLTPE